MYFKINVLIFLQVQADFDPPKGFQEGELMINFTFNNFIKLSPLHYNH